MADRQTRLALTGGQDLRCRNWRDGQHRRGRLGKEAVGLGALGQHSAQDRAHLAEVEANPSTGEGFDQFHQGGVTGFGVGHRLMQGSPKGLTGQIRTPPLDRAQGGDHQQGLLQQR